MRIDSARFGLCLTCLAAAAFAGETRSWVQSDFADFQKGARTNLAIRSDGRLTLAPKRAEVFDASNAYLWAVARDSHGAVYTGGAGAKLYRIAPGAKGEKLAEFDALEIHALAVDSKDRIYAATAPDGKVYRVDAAGKIETFYDPKQKYIWAMAFDAAGNLFVATGDRGEIHKVGPDGGGQVFFKSDETHVRSIAVDKTGSLIAGTEPAGLVIRISPKGEGFVVYQMAKREVTALAVGPANEIYAAAVGNKAAGGALSLQPTPAPPPPPPPPPASTTATGVAPAVVPAPAIPVATGPVAVQGGSEIYVLPERGAPRRVWSGAQDVVYALALDARGRLLVGAGNKGSLYRLEEHDLYTTLTNFPVEQTTALVAASDGSVYAATGNIGKVFRIGPGLEAEGTIESDVFDSGGYATWGRMQAGADPHGGRIMLSARSGNLDRPRRDWSAWSAPVNGVDGGKIDAPPARFLQWKATLTASGAESPTLDSVDAAYLRQNVTPRIDRIEATPYNYRFPAPASALTLSSGAPLTLPAIGAKVPSPRFNADSNTYPAMTYQKGALGVRWTSSDENGDSMMYTVEIRGAKERAWRLLRDKIREKYYSFDSTAFPDGEYRVRITVTDAPSNTPEDALSSSEESDPFTIDNTPPAISALALSGGTLKWRAADALSIVYKAEYSIDGGEWVVADPVGKLSDSRSPEYAVAVKGLGAGEHTVAVRVWDENDNVAVQSAEGSN